MEKQTIDSKFKDWYLANYHQSMRDFEIKLFIDALQEDYPKIDIIKEFDCKRLITEWNRYLKIAYQEEFSNN